ncbi:hypothetical protein DFH08DRAFT_285916 [Mycena albidolilacea]|uniref:F-box domain-containing protein n=1 Tax=Mycena albidolilacea TaxID=1033008 RepID=A0AAD6ZRM1_9AGAR|nr:hypothetical protein DFH08DRAFT_285916 [Mycena albidolilacea]
MGTPIYSLPNEIIIAIAAAGQEGHTGARTCELRPTKIIKPEWALSHTSRRFRDVTVGAPALWAVIEIIFDLPGSVEILNLYLQCSQGCKVSATFRTLPSEDSMEGHGLFIKGLGQILLHIERLWKFAIILDSGFARKLLAPLRDVGAPHLQDLEVVSLCDDPVDVELFSSGAPRLSFVRIYGLRLELPAPSWTVALTHLELRMGQAVDDLVAIQCPSLVHLHLDIYWTRARGKGNSRIYIPTLKSLNISILVYGAPFPLPAVIDLFDTPALTELVIGDVHGDQIVHLLNNASTLHPFPALTALSFISSSSYRYESDPPRFAHPPAALFPALSSLTLINECRTSHMVRDILGQPWPQLETLALSPPCGDFTAVVEVLKDALLPDHDHRRPLPKLRLPALLLALEDGLGDQADIEVFEPPPFEGFQWWH